MSPPAGVSDPRTASWSLSLDDHPAMIDVRRWVRGHLKDVVTADKLADIMLVVVELVTNAKQHTDSPHKLAVSHRHDVVRIEVTDGDPAPPVLQPPSTTRLGGRGIRLVDALSAAWGVRRCGPGKAVWSLVKATGPNRAT